MCSALADWYVQHKERGTIPRPGALDQVYEALGGKFGTPKALFWPDSDRSKCKKFERNTPREGA